MKPLERLFWDELAEMLHVEELLLKALPKMRDAATNEKLKETFEDYREAVQAQAQRVRDVFAEFELPKREKKCDAMMGLLIKGQQLMQRNGGSASLDAALVSLSRRLNGYKISSYQTLGEWAKVLKAKDLAKRFEKTGRAEHEFASDLDSLAADITSDAAEQVEETARTQVARPKPSKDLVAGARWGQW